MHSDQLENTVSASLFQRLLQIKVFLQAIQYVLTQFGCRFFHSRLFLQSLWNSISILKYMYTCMIVFHIFRLENRITFFFTCQVAKLHIICTKPVNFFEVESGIDQQFESLGVSSETSLLIRYFLVGQNALEWITPNLKSKWYVELVKFN